MSHNIQDIARSSRPIIKPRRRITPTSTSRPAVPIAGSLVQLGDDVALIEDANVADGMRDSPRRSKRKAEALENGGKKVQRDLDRATGGNPSSPKKRRTEETVPNQPRIPLHEKPCGHEVHPALADYTHPRCPTCRVRDAMHDVQRVQDLILNRGGITEWRKKIEGGETSWEHYNNSVRGSKPKASRNGTIDINGNDSSYRSAKMRLANLLVEFEDMSVLERGYDIAPPLENDAQDIETKTAHMQYSATNAISLYNAAAEEGKLEKLNEVESEAMHRRGKVKYRKALEETDSEEESTDESEELSLPASKRVRSDLDGTPPRPLEARARKKPGAKVSFDRLDSNHTIIQPVSAPKILRTTPSEVDPEVENTVQLEPELETTLKGKKSNPISELDVEWFLILQGDGPRRKPKDGFARRHTYHYKPGKWTVSGDNEVVDTSGYIWDEDHDSWVIEVKESQMEALELDISDREEDIRERAEISGQVVEGGKPFACSKYLDLPGLDEDTDSSVANSHLDDSSMPPSSQEIQDSSEEKSQAPSPQGRRLQSARQV
ncbi:hypothetical protein CC86DRAFT_471401 [Ophiobolus disseminans]|uniref:Uncharacterized protein n=1 Tax=Ophiobolus disseminans TaxID=1469910 RepID=A0A6A6ZHD7_9PLEO|nr:hypothetical protein CC86DRAFT_471401 [Ophiobolus disseminans]